MASWLSFAPIFSQICSPVNSGNNNALDWENTSSFTFYLSSNGGAPTLISNPFFATGTTCNNNISPFCNPPSPNNDISSADGWRYVSHDFGQSGNPIECPVFILYNIHSGILRVFFYKSLTTPSNSGVVSLDYKTGAKRTALLEHYGGVVRNAVEVFDNTNKSILVPNTYVLSPSWSHADFVTQYDPCTCQSTSAYNFKLVSTSNSNISFTVNGQIKQDIKASQTNGSTKGFTLKTGNDGLTALENLFGLGAGTPPAPAYNNVFNDIVGYFGKIGKVVKAVDFFIGLFKKEPAPPKIMPLIFNANLTGSGTIITDNPLQQKNLNNPGSDLSNVSVGNRPVYNNVMGTFSLLQTPQIVYNLNTETSCNDIWEPDYNTYSTNCYYDVTAQFSNIGNIKWVLIPQSQLTVTNLVASYIIGGPGFYIESEPLPLGCFSDYHPVFFIGTGSSNSLFTWGNSMPSISYVHLKITGSFDAPNNQKLVSTALYKVNLVEGASGSGGLTEILPDENCNSITPPATFSEIQAVCNSASYTSRRDQYFKAPIADDVVNKQKDKKLDKADVANKMSFQLSPNPADNNLKIHYNLTANGSVKIDLYDLSGRAIKSIADYPEQKEGDYNLESDLVDVPSGIYLLVMDLNGKKETKKLSVLKN